MPITKHDKQELDQICNDFSGQYGGCKNDYFTLLYLTKKFKLRVDEIAHQVAFGGNDYGLDGYHIDPVARNLYLYQFKWSENHNLFKESMEQLAKKGMERIFGSPLADPSQNELLNNLRADLHEHKSLIERVFIHFVFKGDVETADNSEGLHSRRENLENKSHLLHQYFNNPQVELTVEFISDRRKPPLPPPVETHTIALSDSTCIHTGDGKQMYVGFIPLMDLYRIFKSLTQRFFDRNIRFGLSADNPPNRHIRAALADIVLKGKVPPDYFCFNHNGITLAAEQLTPQDGHAIVRVPRLLNGAQTITSLAQFLQDNEEHPLLKANGGLLESIRVLAKIVVDDPFSDFVTNVTICNNRQNPVEPWNLRANDRIQCDLHDKFKEDVGVFYSRHENAFRSYSVDELEEMGYESPQDIRIRPLAQTFLAVQGEVKKMAQLPDVFENQKYYEDTFRESYLHCDARKIIVAYKIHLVLRDPMQRLEDLASKKNGYAVARARNLVWALLIQGVLNDPKLQDVLDEFGTSVRKEGAFREYLRKLASSRILPILKEVLGRDEYQSKLSDEKYDFLKSKEFFSHCKDVAYDKFTWAKKSF